MKVVIPQYETRQAEEQKAARYRQAITHVEKGDYKTAYGLLDGLNYGDSEWLQSAISCWDKPQHQSEKIVPGSYYVFGAYEQDNDLTNGKEDIEWLVLAREDNRILVTSRYALDCQLYNDEYEPVTWETCSLRKWLNESFLVEAFSESEQAMIQTTTVNTDESSMGVQDKIYLLSVTEAEDYFATDSARKCIPSPYAIANGAYTNEAKVQWWLRSSGYYGDSAAIVYTGGGVNAYGDVVNRYDVSVRPALWLNL